VRRLAAAAATGALLLLAGPAAAENPVLDADADADVAASLAEATEVQGVCYGYELRVDDQDSGIYSGTFGASSLGPGTPASAADPRCRGGVVELVAAVTYTSEFSEAEDFASWSLASTLPALTIGDVEELGLSAGDLLDDGRSERVLLNAVLALPRLAAEQAGKEPVVLEPNTEPLPADARPTGTPGSDWLRENAVLLGLCVALVLGGVLLLVVPSRPVRSGARAATSFLDL
jgi:hypothetical protein